MKKYTNRTVILIYINLLIGVLAALEEFEVTNFVDDSNAYLLPVTFFFTVALWNGSLILDKRKK
jgi:hypothetical protein